MYNIFIHTTTTTTEYGNSISDVLPIVTVLKVLSKLYPIKELRLLDFEENQMLKNMLKGLIRTCNKAYKTGERILKATSVREELN